MALARAAAVPFVCGPFACREVESPLMLCRSHVD